MKILSKNKLSLSVAALVGAMGVSSSANAVHFATDGLGDALLNYYTVNGPRTTLINYTNTSDQTIALKVRLHESEKSRPVDFTVILSPWDVWNATIAKGASGGPIIFTADQSCTIPTIGTIANPTDLTAAFLDAGASGEWINEGYVEAIVMASRTGGHNDIDCEEETGYFTDKDNGGFEALMGRYGQYTNNAIKGVYNILNIDLGQNAASGMTTLANFFNSSAPSAPYSTETLPDYPAFAVVGVDEDLKSLVTLQLDPANIQTMGGFTAEQKYLASFYLPTLASANTPAYVIVADNAIGTTANNTTDSETVGAAAVSYLFNRTNVINMWTAFDGDWDTATDLVVQSYVKAYFVDDESVEIAGRYQWKPGVPHADILGNGNDTAPFQNLTGPQVGNGYSCDRINFTVYNREEDLDPQLDDPQFSPTPDAIDAICNETNVISFNESYPLGSPNSYNIDSSFENGWIDLDLRNEGNLYPDKQYPWPLTADAGLYHYGLPVDSFAFTTRTRTGLNEAIIVPSAYQRAVNAYTVNPLAD